MLFIPHVCLSCRGHERDLCPDEHFNGSCCKIVTLHSEQVIVEVWAFDQDTARTFEDHR